MTVGHLVLLSVALGVSVLWDASIRVHRTARYGHVLFASALVILALLTLACASTLKYSGPPPTTAAEFLKLVEADYNKHGKDGSCAIDTVRDDGWVCIICQRRDGTPRQYDTWLRRQP